jgi:hypothetical protein
MTVRFVIWNNFFLWGGLNFGKNTQPETKIYVARYVAQWVQLTKLLLHPSDLHAFVH